MLLTIALFCTFTADEPSFNGLKLTEWTAMAKDDPIARKRKSALIALGQMMSKDTQDGILTTAARVLRRDSQSTVRIQAIMLIGQQPVDLIAACLPDLTEALREEKDAAVKKEIANALGRVGPAALGAVIPLIDGLQDGASVKIACAEALGRIGKPASDAAAPLLTMLDDRDANVRRASAFALGRIEAEDAANIAAAFARILTEHRMVERKLCPTAALVGGLSLGTLSSELVHTVIVSLGLLSVKSESLTRAMAMQLTDVDEDLRRVAAQTLGSYGPFGGVAEAELRLAMNTDSDPTVRVYAIRALALILKELPSALVGLFLERLSAEKHTEARIALISELGGLGPAAAAATSKLKEFQKDQDAKVREAATLAIQRITKTNPKK